ncbi:spectrin beta chain, non-erythrocytic 1-like isoform X9 [Portunus trituberculatus]|uniref:spectrin beta chain, non-erythrocytic 1-like isoform X9 n=1 Tax=Portunus trituberculatus TaxID=210409 RepID=UPI001E1CD517|nr:spectrin beta chain, non-erythrocytic 1-like isoform X9 [Portunus trituberculatus]
MSSREDPLRQFETGRIQHLREERLGIQKKTFTKWMNSFLVKARLEVVDLFTDLADGKMLLKLLEIISGEKLGKPNNGKMRVHKIENVNKSLAFLHTKVRLESIGAEDIVDGNPRLILGLIWTIILRFQIQEIEIDVDEENESSEKKSAKDALLLWCQRKTAGYRGVQIEDFSRSWRDGLGFNALIHAHRPDIIDYNSLIQKNHIDNLNNAFTVAETHLGIASILDAEDVDTNKPDEKSIITYVASYYHTFARMKNELKGSKRIANIITQLKDVDDLKLKYEKILTSLLEWIIRKIVELDSRKFPNSLDGIQKLLLQFKKYRTEEKPPKYKERSEIEALFFSINASLKALNQPVYVPKDGQLIHDIEREWNKLEKAEHRREVALRDELLRQERLEQLAYKFDKKSVLRKGYLEEMIQVLSDSRYGSNLSQVEATVKKHEAISADILARQERFEDLTKMADELDIENYHGKEAIRKKEKDILKKWSDLLDLLNKHKTYLHNCCILVAIMREVDTITASIKELEANFCSDDVGRHLLAVEDLLQKHALMESQVHSMGETIKRLNKQGEACMTSNLKDAPLLQKRLQELNQGQRALLKKAAERRLKLEEARDLFQFEVDMEEEEAWVIEKQRICLAGVIAKDIGAVISLQQKHKALEDEMCARRPKSEKVMRSGEALMRASHPDSKAISERIGALKEKWRLLEQYVNDRRRQLEDAAEACLFNADANEAESWIKEKVPLCQSTDYGEDEPSGLALLQLHARLEEEIKSYDGDIKAINSQGQKLIKSGISALNLMAQQQSVGEEEEYEWVDEVKMVPQEVMVEEVVEKMDEVFVTEQREMPTVISRYPFQGQGMSMVKGETMFLLSKTNNDWWNVRKANGEEGFVPANYVRESEPRKINVRVKKEVKAPEKRMVPRTRMVKKTERVKKRKPKAPPRRRGFEEPETVEKRLQAINSSYGHLCDLAGKRHLYLEESIKLFSFMRECQGFETWMREKEKLLKVDDKGDNVEAAKKKFEQFLTDLSAASKRIDIIDKMVKDFEDTGHSQLEKIKKRQKQIHDQWAHLNRLKQQKELSLKGASSVELFHRTCDETRDWMLEKMEKLDTDELGRDLKTVQSLQRKHDQLERELAPVEEKVRRVNLLADSVKASYPRERHAVEARQEEVQQYWGQLKGKAVERRNRLEEAVGQQIFLNSAKSLLNWVGDVKNELNSNEPARDVTTAEILLKSHQDLGDDIRAHQDEFSELSQLGEKLLKRNPDFAEVKEKMAQLGEEQRAIHRGWQEKGDWLRQCMDLQLFNREADQIDAATSSHETFLDYKDLGSTLDDVEALMKRHDDFENTLMAQDERLRAFSEMADKLITAEHYEATYINERRNQVRDRRASVKARAQARREQLNGSVAYQQFKADADDFDKWMGDKKKMADDESYRDLSNLERKIQKHEAFERELHANEGQLRRLNKTGQDLIGMKHYQSRDIQKTLDDLNKKWKDLCSKTEDKGTKLRQANNQHTYNKDLEETEKNLEALESALNNKDVGSDLHSCKDLMKKQNNLDNDLNTMERKISDLCNTGDQMVADGHFDSDNIKASCVAAKKRFNNLKDPAARRRAALEESLRWHEFNFEVDAEMQWIKEHMTLATSTVLGQNLHEAQTLNKKHIKLKAEIQGHQPQIDKCLAKGKKLCDEHHPEKGLVSGVQWPRGHSVHWTPRQSSSSYTKRHRLAKSPQRYPYNMYTPPPLNQAFNSLSCRTEHAHCTCQPRRLEQIVQRCEELQEAWNDLLAEANERSRKLELNLKAQQYFFEVTEVEAWMNEKRNILQTKDYGKDEDVARKLLAKHKALELEMDTYSGIVKEMGTMAESMIKSSHPESKLIKDRQQMLNQELKDLQKLSANLRQKLMASMYRHEYFREAEDLEKWITEQMQTATSEDFGHDYEHLLLLQAKFDDFKHRVEAGSERFKQCDELAKKLIANESPYASVIDRKQEQLSKGSPSSSPTKSQDPATQVTAYHKQVRAAWNSLLEHIEARDQKLEAAGEIHRFNRDVAEALARIQEKFKSIPEELGRDVQSVQSLLRKHEGFENDLVALEAQLQVLVDDSARLQAAYPGSNAEHIAEQQALVVENWNVLQDKASKRKEQLLAAADLQKFLAHSRDLISWSSDLRATMKAEEKVRDAASAQGLKTEHERIKAEIEAREDEFSRVVESGGNMIEEQHYASSEVEERVNKVLEERSQLHAAWQHKKVYLDQLIDLHFFLRDAKQLDTISSSQEAYLSTADFGNTIEQVDAQVKKHDAFEKLVLAQDEKLDTLKNHGSKLIEQNHFDSPHIKKRVDEVVQRRDRVKDSSKARKRQLEDALLYAQFIRDVRDANMWIDEKANHLDADKLKGDVTSFDDKVRKLQKHQAFLAELQAHECSIKEITDKGAMLINKRHKSAAQIKDELDHLVERWTRLVLDAESHSRGLEEAQDILEFNTQIEKVDAWIRDKEMMVQVGDLGKDYEHCMALHRKLDDVDSDMRVDDARFTNINKLADKIIKQGCSDNKSVQQRKNDLNHKWQALKGAIDRYRADLEGALETHAFNRDVDDTKDRISEKAVILANEDTGKDLMQVETLQRKQETIIRDMSAIEKKIKEHEKNAHNLSRKYPAKKDPIIKKQAEVLEAWSQLCERSHGRKDQLTHSYTMHKFQADLRELERWGEDIVSRMNASPLPNNSAEAEMLLQSHQEMKVEIDGRKDVFKGLQKFGKELVANDHFAKQTIQQNLETLSEIENKVVVFWTERQKVLKQAHQMQVFLEMTEQAKSWLASKEAFLNNDDVGDSLASVEELIKKHEGFEKTFEAQGNKIEQLEAFAKDLLNNDHYDSEGIRRRLKVVLEKRDVLKEKATLRAKKLQESKSLQQFLRNVYEVEGWISEKLQVACDESYRDPTNLQSKIQKHGAFEAEVLANSGRVMAVSQEGEGLISNGHYAEQEIQARLDGLDTLWKQLQDSSLLKKERLHEAYQALLFNRTLDDLESWIDDTENQLQSEDHGRDLTSVQSLLKKHQQLEADIAAHQSEIDQARDVAQSFATANHFMWEDITDRVEGVTKRYNSLHEPIHIRRENLEDAMLLQQLLRDIEDEMLWVAEKEPLAGSQDLGASLTAVQNLQKKHQALEAEIQSHEPVINTVNSRAQQMIRSGHFASGDIEAKIKQLLVQLSQLKDTASLRRLRLLDAVESQMFYSEVSEAEAWMKEKKPLLTSQDFGKDELSVGALTKKLDNVSRDMEGFKATVTKLSTLCLKLTERKHFDSENISKKMQNVEQQFAELQVLLEKRAKRLEESRKLFVFLRESDEVAEWLNEQMTVAASEDYGRDVEHVEILIQKFDSFLTVLAASEEKLITVKAKAKVLLDEKHPEPAKIQNKVDELQQLWEDLRELASARQEALAGAKQVHVFDRNADETISWISEKDAFISSEDYGHDLETIQSLARKHQGFERDLAAVKEQVESVVEEAKRLAELFPDAREHIAVKHEETVEAWNDLLDKSAQRKDKLYQAEKLQSYFDDYRELMAWLSEILAKITAPDLPKDVPGAEAVISRHREYKTEIDARSDAFDKFCAAGNALIDQGHFMAEEIAEKIAVLESRRKFLLETWKTRYDTYARVLDLRQYMRDIQVFETWIESREAVVKDDQMGESIPEVEELIRRHDDFLKAIDAQEDKLDPIKRITMIEADFQAQKKREETAKRAEVARKEQERMENMKRKEVQRITDERRREDERRRTQEIKFTKEDMERVRLNMNGDYSKVPPSSRELDSQSSSSSEAPETATTPEGHPRKNLEVPESGGLYRSGSQTSLSSLKRDLKRAESMKVDLKKAKRTPSFTTRRRTQSFRKHKRMENMANLPPVEIQGYLERKQELQSGGKKATIRSWKGFYTVLCGQLLCFFKDEEDFYDQKAASPPISIHQAKIEVAGDYTKKKHVFRIITRDNAEYLLLAESEENLEEWVTKLKFHAELPPSMQLMSYDNHKEGEVGSEMVAVPSRDSDNSSGHSTPEVRHRGAVSSHPQGAGGGLDPTRPHSQALDNPLYANLEHMQDKAKPPVPPRGGSTSNRSSRSSLGEEGPIYQNRISVVPSYEVSAPENTYQNYPPDRPNGHRRDSSENMNGEDLPPLPRSAPPHVMARPPVPPNRARYGEQSWVGVPHHPGMPPPGVAPHHRPQMGHTVGHHHQVAQHPTSHVTHFSQVSRVSHHQYSYTPQGSSHHPDLTDGVPGSRQVGPVIHVVSPGVRNPYSEYTSRTMSLPQGSSLPPTGSVHTSSGPTPSHRNSATIDRQGLSESSSEGDVPVSTNKKEKEKKGSVFKFFGRRKGAQV